LKIVNEFALYTKLQPIPCGRPQLLIVRGDFRDL